MTLPVLFSGIQPSGSLMIGNYFGAILPWLNYQESHECYFCLVDLHAITVRQDPKQLRQQTLDALAWYLACGLDAQQHHLFIQSHVPAHTELAWALSSFTSMGQLNRMTQFKDKAQRHEDNLNAALFSYPILMAADILLYQTATVPVGDDQKQHLELTRDLATRFNHHIAPVFTVPEPQIPTWGARIMSLQNPQQKMSKSDPNEQACIRLLDSPSQIQHKLKRSVTDSLNNIALDADSQPGVTNLLTLLALASHTSPQTCCEELTGQGYGALKSRTADALIAMLEPLQQRYHHFRDDEAALLAILAEGAAHARATAQITRDRVYEALGLITE